MPRCGWLGRSALFLTGGLSARAQPEKIPGGPFNPCLQNYEGLIRSARANPRMGLETGRSYKESLSRRPRRVLELSDLSPALQQKWASLARGRGTLQSLCFVWPTIADQFSVQTWSVLKSEHSFVANSSFTMRKHSRVWRSTNRGFGKAKLRTPSAAFAAGCTMCH